MCNFKRSFKHHCFCIFIELFHERRKTKTKEITVANQRTHSNNPVNQSKLGQDGCS